MIADLASEVEEKGSEELGIASMAYGAFLDNRVSGHENCKRITGTVIELFRMNDDNNPNVLTLCPVRCDRVLYRLEVP